MAENLRSSAVLVLAAGRGTRASGVGGLPKQYRSLGGMAVVARAITPFLGLGRLGPVAVVIHPDDAARYRQAVAPLAGQLLEPIPGGATRQASVLAGLEALARHQPTRVLIHDAARPFVSTAVIDRVLDALTLHQGAIPALPVADTLKRAGRKGLIEATIPRANLFAAQTPQGFAFAAILAAHRQAQAAGRNDFTDDAAIAEWAGHAVALVPGETVNRKLTTEEDLAMAERHLSAGALTGTRIGSGFDVHKFGPGDHVWLCGVRIPFSAGLIGHSDADAALHALTDALLGAIADGDIGQHFPPSDPQWKGAPSELFLKDAVARVTARSGQILNVDVTILCEAPRIAPHRDAMRARIAGIIGIKIEQVSVKATTTEGLGFTGRREGIAAQATAAVLLADR